MTWHEAAQMNKERMERRRKEIIREYRQKAHKGNMFAVQKLFDFDALEPEDIRAVAEKRGMLWTGWFLSSIGYPVDYQPADAGNPPQGV